MRLGKTIEILYYVGIASFIEGLFLLIRLRNNPECIFVKDFANAMILIGIILLLPGLIRVIYCELKCIQNRIKEKNTQGNKGKIL